MTTIQRKWYPNPSWIRWEDCTSRERVQLKWYAIRTQAVPGSLEDIPWEEQLALLQEHEEVPRVCELFYAAKLYTAAEHFALFSDHTLNCTDLMTSITQGPEDDEGATTRGRIGLQFDHHRSKNYLAANHHQDHHGPKIGLACMLKMP